MKIEIKSVRPEEMRFTSVGDWAEDVDCIHIWILEMSNIKFWFTVLAHELTEICLCKALGVTSYMADEFDRLWEKELKEGLHCPQEEAGEDPRCPYRVGHMAGEKVEMFMSLVLGFDFEDYCRYCDNLC